MKQLTDPGGVVVFRYQKSGPVAGESPPAEAPGRFRAGQFASPVLACLAVASWLIGLRPVPPSSMGSLGLIPELSWLVLLAYPLLLAAVVVELLRHKPRAAVLGVLTVLGVFGVYGLQPAVEEVARLPVSWLHTGFANYIGVHGDVKHEFDARFAWPGFFSFVAFVVRASGQTDAAPLMNWAPVALSGLATLGVRAIAVVVLGDGRAAWLATWVFLLANWTEQDYFSPQATTFVLMLAALALTVQHLVRPGLLSSVKAFLLRRRIPYNAPSDRVGAHLLILVIAAALAPSHQLSPYVLGGLLGVMLLSGRLWPAWLPALALIPPVVWFALNAKEFWFGQLRQITGDIGNVGSSVNQGINSRFVGDSGRELILWTRIGITGAVWLLAVAGFIVLWRLGTRTVVLPALAVMPFGLAAVQSYGGEVFMRCYLFSLPFLAIAAGVALGAVLDRVVAQRQVKFDRRGMVWAGAVWVVLALFCAATVTARGGNDAYVSMTNADVAAVREVYQLASPGQRVESLASYAPLNSARLDDLVQGSVDDNCANFNQIADCVMKQRPDFLVVNPSQEAYGRIYYGLELKWTDRIVKYLVDSGRYRVVFDQNRSRVLASTGASG